MPDQIEASPAPKSPRKLRIIDLVRPHWKALTIALVAVLGETLTDILDPWPIKMSSTTFCSRRSCRPCLRES